MCPECNEITITVDTLEKTVELASIFAETIKPGDILCLSGDLGAGKTTFTQALCKALGVTEHVTSPTFNIMNQYEGRLPIYHFDVYRIAEPDEMYEIGFDEYLNGMGVSIIEWAPLVEVLIPEDAVWMIIKTTGETSRTICLRGPSEKLGRLTHEVIGH
ncbi:tRNA (adenosine(37)-N6)-threonylcarbamoyltransferase complex ATPase subunit type 1 TsaE [Fusibacter paucivorans]|uniref:tRNA threonylcarbamoyladenosine biosynthesis protein TsaE n=2 Tax=Fusibacter paucivorans TaxID=76009 RepID=A0ABS5PLK9_9FIRM|nr:tRNA (adenosine(37)-N6)-threonylcarbamoyltransferase complex ATPase subunit type 1 TsaE [Fusibacter paucivorans]